MPHELPYDSDLRDPPNTFPTVERAVDLSLQGRVDPKAFSIFTHLVRGASGIPSWWSTTRDAELRKFWKRSDHLSGAIYSIEAKISSIPISVTSKKSGDYEHILQAEQWTDLLHHGAEYGEGWVSFASKFVEDLLTQDNGAFAEVIGHGDPTGPIVGQPVSVKILDSSRCQRTGDVVYPVVYQDIGGRQYKLHWTRVMMSSQMASPMADMFGVGFCGVSRCINVAQTLLDVLTYKQEKMGSRPRRDLLVTRGGLDPTDIADAFRQADAILDSMGLSRYSKTVVVGEHNLPDADIRQIEMSTLPDGFNEEDTVTLGMSILALGLGVDPRELFPGMTAGATRADALLSHIKQRGKFPGQVIEILRGLFGQKFLPPQLQLTFDFQDDTEDRMVADIWEVRSKARKNDIDTGVITIRASRERMLTLGEINREQFETMELIDGRQEDGTSLLNLFYSVDPINQEYTDVGVDDPLDILANDPNQIVNGILDRVRKDMAIVSNSTSHSRRWRARKCKYALASLLKLYINEPGIDPHLVEATQGLFGASSGLFVTSNSLYKPGATGQPPVGDEQQLNQINTNPPRKDPTGEDADYATSSDTMTPDTTRGFSV